LQEEGKGVADYNCGKQGSDFTAPKDEGKKKCQHSMERDSGGYADKCSHSNTAGQDTWMPSQANESQVVVSGGAARLKFH
jgi:hypothetical protein